MDEKPSGIEITFGRFLCPDEMKSVCDLVRKIMQNFDTSFKRKKSKFIFPDLELKNVDPDIAAKLAKLEIALVPLRKKSRGIFRKIFLK